MEALAITFLTKIAEKLLDTIIDDLGEHPSVAPAREWFRGDLSKFAYQRALAAAISAFARKYPEMVEAFFDESFLNSIIVRKELAKFFKRNQYPDKNIIIEAWLKQFGVNINIDISEPVNYFLEILEAELKGQSAFGPIFDSRSREELNTISKNTSMTTILLDQIRELLEDINSLYLKESEKVRFRDAYNVLFDNNSIYYQYLFSDNRGTELGAYVYDYTSLINEKTNNFTGRAHVLNQISKFTESHPSGYFVLQGEPGIGKTSIAAHLVKSNRLIHHFAIAAQGLSRVDQFLGNIAAQLISKYRLKYIFSPQKIAFDSNYLTVLLEAVASKLSKGEKLIIVIDALDEVEIAVDTRANVLYLPPRLPEQVYVITTSRPLANMNLQVERREDYFLDASSSQNQEDVCEYLKIISKTELLSRWLEKENIKPDVFVDILLNKSEANFMYIYYVLQELESPNYSRASIYQLPQGLIGYYETHWRQIRSQDETTWISYRLPVLSFLAAVSEPISISRLAHLSNLPATRIRSAINDWRQFLDKVIIDGEENYKIYHTSFQDFLKRKGDIGEIDFRSINSAISDKLFEDWKKIRGSKKYG